jgi:hypothetical protein
MLAGLALIAAGIAWFVSNGVPGRPAAPEATIDRDARTAAAGLRPPTALEVFFSAVALDFEDSRFCDRVPPEAHATASFSARVDRAVLERSECYRRLAIRLRRPELCERVELPGSTATDDGTYSAAGCAAAIASGGSWRRDGWLPAAADFIAIMRRLGYDRQTVGEPVGSAEKAYADFYLDLAHGDDAPRRADFLKRVRRLAETDR